MNNEDLLICKDFEHDIWLYIDNTLSAEKNEFWDSHLSRCKECSKLIKEINSITELVREETTLDIIDSTFDRMIEKSFSAKNISKRKSIWWWLAAKHAFALKVAVISTLAIVAVMISLTSRQPNPIKNISQNIFDWEGSHLTMEINEVSKQLNKLDKDNWQNQINQINGQLNQLEKKSDKFSFN